MQEKLNDKHITFYEILKLANDSKSPVDDLKLYMKKDGRFTTMLGYALNPAYKMSLPDGVPPYIPSQHEIGLAPLEILNTHNKLYIMYNKDTRQYKKEEIFIQWIEAMAAQEAELMIRIKDQTLDSAFPNLTIDIFLAALGWSKEQYNSLLAKHRSNVVNNSLIN